MSWTPLLKLCIHDEEGTDLSLVSRDKLKSFQKQIEQRTVTGSTPLHFVALGNNIQLAKWLIEKGEIRENDCGATPLHWACKGGNNKIIRLLLAKMSTEQILRKDEDGYTAYHWALEYENCEAIQLLKPYFPRSRKLGRK